MIMQNGYISLQNESLILGKDEKDVFELIKFGNLSAREIQRRTYIPQADVDRYLKRFGKQSNTKSKKLGR